MIPPFDLAAPIVFFPVRHHSPACAWHVGQLIRQMRPGAVLIEGPRDATPLIPLLTHPQLKAPVAIFATYVRPGERLAERFSAYYPLCDYSPELEAIRAAVEIGAASEFIDLSYPEKVESAATTAPGRADSMLEERMLLHSRMLQRACEQSGARDPDDLWDRLYETDFLRRDCRTFIENVLAYCALSREGYTPEMLAREGCLLREAAMADAILAAAAAHERVLVVTGGFHTVALLRAAERPGGLRKLARKRRPRVPGESHTVLMRYGFEQLDRLNGYASGMPSPEFYQLHWEALTRSAAAAEAAPAEESAGCDRERDQERDAKRLPEGEGRFGQASDYAAELIVETARRCRGRNLPVTPADEIEALGQMWRLAELRGSPTPAREDLLDGIRSLFVKGAIDVEGVVVLAVARGVMTGERIGETPPEAGQPPIVDDFRSAAKRARLKLSAVGEQEVTLDLYRRAAHRECSRLLFQLDFLDIPFARWVRGPDFVNGSDLQRIQEIWRYQWTPGTEAALIERSLFGSTVSEAAANRLLEQFVEAERQGQGRRADGATRLVMQCCRMGLHQHAPELLSRTAELIADDQAVDSLVTALHDLLALHVSREPLEAQQLPAALELAGECYRRACYLLPELAHTPPESEAAMLEALNALQQAAATLPDASHALRWRPLEQLLQTPEAAPALRGGAAGSLFGDGQLDAEQLVEQLAGHLQSGRGDAGPSFLRGVLKTARSALWRAPQCLRVLHRVLRSWDEDQFVAQLPNLRLALADLTPRECDQVAGRIAAELGGAAALKVPRRRDVSAAAVLRAADVNRRVRRTLARDGLEAFGE